MAKYVVHIHVEEQRPADAIGDWAGEDVHLLVDHNFIAPDKSANDIAAIAANGAVDAMRKQWPQPAMAE